MKQFLVQVALELLMLWLVLPCHHQLHLLLLGNIYLLPMIDYTDRGQA
jgi:hypothetical protein